ncbi:hypothetical protein [Hoeflea sp.]|uniref:hypothetical protein n=1 Tax=Hoeflea sp. TaxID=1940281 RepID=UPI003B024BB7
MHANVKHRRRETTRGVIGRRSKPPLAGALLGKRESCGAREGTEDLCRIARTIGFTPKEVSEIEALYLRTPKGALKRTSKKHKTRRAKAPG